MDVKEAVRKAKDHVEVMFEGENLQNVGLEEVTFNESNKRWLVTVGFSRVWKYKEPTTWNETMGGGTTRPGSSGRKEYKVIEISDVDGKTHSITIREFKGRVS